MHTKSFLANDQQIEAIRKKYQKYETESKNPYVIGFFQTNDETISIYSTKKVVIQSKTEMKETTTKREDFQVHAGSDESGVGDYFGPLTVCACIVGGKDVDQLLALGVKDSKQLNDEKIKNIAPQLMEMLKYSLLILDNQTYNQQVKKYNSNGLKAILHNQAFLNLEKKFGLPVLRVIDQFCAEKTYYGYLAGKEKVALQFHTKAENQFLAVACASIIARYAFIMHLEKMGMQFKVKFPLGAGENVDAFGKTLVNQYGKDILKYVAKVHFSNTQRILSHVDLKLFDN